MPVASFPFHEALLWPVWPWWDFLGRWDVWGWGRWHGPSPACPRQQRSSKHVQREGRAVNRGGTASGGKVRLGDNSDPQLAPSIEDSGTNPAAFSCFAPTYDFFQPIPAPGNVPIATVVANSSRCAVSQRSPWPAGAFLNDDMFWDERGGGLTSQPVGPFGDTATTTIADNTNRVDPRSFSSRCCTFQRTHTRSVDPIRLLCIRLTLPLTLSLPSRFAPSARLMVGVSPRTLWLAEAFSCDCTFWDERGGGLTGQPLDPLANTATITAVMSANRVESGRFSSRCCTFRRTQTSADPIRLLCIRLALPSTLSLPSRFSPSSRVMAFVSPRALWLMGNFSCDCTFWDERGGGLTRQPVCPFGDASAITTAMGANCVDLGVLARDVVRVYTRAQTLFGYFVSD